MTLDVENIDYCARERLKTIFLTSLLVIIYLFLNKTCT